jgi:hypothetical protein
MTATHEVDEPPTTRRRVETHPAATHLKSRLGIFVVLLDMSRTPEKEKTAAPPPLSDSCLCVAVTREVRRDMVVVAEWGLPPESL